MITSTERLSLVPIYSAFLMINLVIYSGSVSLWM